MERTFTCLAGEQVFVSVALARHLVDEGDGLRLGGDHIVVLGGHFFKESLGAGACELDLAENHERADIELVVQRAQRQIAVDAGDIHGVLQ